MHLTFIENESRDIYGPVLSNVIPPKDSIIAIGNSRVEKIRAVVTGPYTYHFNSDTDATTVIIGVSRLILKGPIAQR